MSIVDSKKEIELDDKLKVRSEQRRWTLRRVRDTLKMILGVLFIPSIFVVAYFFYTDYTNHHPLLAPVGRSIAVLPFANNQPNTDSDYLGFAIANQIIGELDYNKSLTVRPANAIRKYNYEPFELSMAAEDLKVNYVLTGNYSMVDDVIRLNIELINANNHQSIFRDNLEVDFSSAFGLSDIVAKKVVDGLGTQFSKQELAMIDSDVSSSPLAYEYFLRSLSLQLSMEGCALALEMLRKSIAIDSTYAPAYAEIGNRANRILVYGSLSERPAEIPAEYYLKALVINENNHDALSGLGARYAETGRTTEAVELMRKALKLNQSSADAHFYLGYIYRYAGMLEESIVQMEIALNLHPNNPRFRSLGISYANSGEYKKAMKAISMDYGSLWELCWRAVIHYQEKEYNEILELSKKARKLDDGSIWMLRIDGYLAAIEGDSVKGVSLARQLEEANTSDNGDLIDAESEYYAATAYIINRNKEGALRCLKKAVDGGYFNYPFMITDHLFESLIDDEEYLAILSLAEEKHIAFKERFF
jgi:TolB-like protein